MGMPVGKLLKGSALVLGIAGAVALFHQAANSAEGGAVPKFTYDGSWPKLPLPNKWTFEGITGMFVDKNDVIWVLNRPRDFDETENAAAVNPPAGECCVPPPAVLAFDAALFDAFGGGAGGGFRIDLLGLIDDNAFELGFLVKEIGDVKKRIAFQSDIHEGGLHAGQHAHHAPFIDVADDALILFTAFDVELSDAIVFHDCDLLFFSVDTNN